MKRFRVVLGASVLAMFACKGQTEAPTAPSASAAPAASAPPVISPEDLPPELRVPTAWPIPSGPRLAILAGQGLGPIRLGATVATIERLMESPCEIKTGESCRYIGRATEFFLKDGVLTEIHTHRPDRPTTPKPRVFGVFNGRTPEGVAFLMLEKSVKELLGPPEKEDKVPQPNEQSTVSVLHYDGLLIEMDTLPNGNVVVGGLNVIKKKGGAPKPPPKK